MVFCQVAGLDSTAFDAVAASRREPIRAAVQEHRFSDAWKSEHNHDHASKTETEPAVRRTAVAEEVQIVLYGITETCLLSLRCKLCITVLALRTSRDLNPVP